MEEEEEEARLAAVGGALEEDGALGEGVGVDQALAAPA